MSWSKVASIVLPIVGTLVVATWRLSGDASDLRHSIDSIQKDQAGLSLRIDKHEQMIEALTQAMPSAKEILSLQTRVDALMSVNATLTSGQSAAEERARQFFTYTWPQMSERLKRIEDKLDRR